MIRHCVFVRFKPLVSATERAEVLYQLQALVGVVDGLENAHFGPNVSPEGLGKGYDHGFIMDFTNAAARDAYLDHPQHLEAAARLLDAAEDGVNGLMVFDFEIDRH